MERSVHRPRCSNGGRLYGRPGGAHVDRRHPQRIRHRAAARSSCGSATGHGILLFQFGCDSRQDPAEGIQGAQDHGLRLGRAPRERDAGDLLRRPEGVGGVDASARRRQLLSRYRRNGRVRRGRRRRLQREHCLVWRSESTIGRRRIPGSVSERRDAYCARIQPGHSISVRRIRRDGRTRASPWWLQGVACVFWIHDKVHR